MDGLNPGSGGGGACGGGCETGDGGACKDCTMCRRHYYWNHASGGKKQFLVVASENFRDSMRIPQEIGSHLRNMIPESKPIKLEAPDGITYEIEVCRLLGGDVVLRTGWKEFVNANHIEEDYSILFVYCGNLIFKVHLFDSSGHEKSSSCAQPPSGIIGAVPPCAPEQVVPDYGHVQISTDFVYTTFPGCCLTLAQDEKVLEIADNMKSEIPLHVAAMNKRNVSLKDSCVYIPLQLVLSYFKDGITKYAIQLEAHKKLYSVGASKHSDDIIVLDSEWDTFVASHNIQEKDLLIFGSNKKSRLKVHILDPSGREKTCSCFVMGNSSGTQEMSGDSVEIVDPPPREVIDLSSSDDDDIVRKDARKSYRWQRELLGCHAKSQKMASTSSPSKKSGHEGHKLNEPGSEHPRFNNFNWPSPRRYILTVGITLTRKAKEIVDEKVQAIGSEFPVFVKVMSTSSVNGSAVAPLSFCTEYASACLPNRNQTLFLRLAGKKMQWNTILAITTNKVRWVHRGWKDFVIDNLIDVGDICLFELAERSKGSLSMTVHLIRKSEIEM